MKKMNPDPPALDPLEAAEANLNEALTLLANAATAAGRAPNAKSLAHSINVAWYGNDSPENGPFLSGRP